MPTTYREFIYYGGGYYSNDCRDSGDYKSFLDNSTAYMVAYPPLYKPIGGTSTLSSPYVYGSPEFHINIAFYLVFIKPYDEDADGDGFYPEWSKHSPATDCDDDNAMVYPGAPEICDGVVNDCNMQKLHKNEEDLIDLFQAGGVIEGIGGKGLTVNAYVNIDSKHNLPGNKLSWTLEFPGGYSKSDSGYTSGSVNWNGMDKSGTYILDIEQNYEIAATMYCQAEGTESATVQTRKLRFSIQPNMEHQTPCQSWHLKNGSYYGGSVCLDADGDGFFPIGSNHEPATDCDDTNPDINPDAEEVCNEKEPKDNDCDGDMDEDCAKLVYVSGSGQTGDICKTLKSPLVVAVEGGKLGQETVDWAITNTPSGKWAEPEFAGGLTSVEEDRVVYKKYFAPGSQGDYEVTASCEKCTNKDAEIPFTSTATCPTVPTYRQTNYPNEPYDNWCKVVDDGGNELRKGLCDALTIGSGENLVEFSIANKGCALTSLAMVMGRYGSMADPVEWDNFLTQIGGYKDGGVVWDTAIQIWNNIVGADEKLIRDPVISTSLTSLDPYLDKCRPVNVMVKHWVTKKDGAKVLAEHWVVVTGKSGNDYLINDPGSVNGTTLAAYENKIYSIRAIYSTGECK